MRDLFTIVGLLLVAVLGALLVVPPFLDWGEYRALVEQALTEATGASVKTEGKLEIRILPAPRIFMQQLHASFDPAAGKGLSLAADNVDTEIALPELLKGKIVFVEAGVERLELTVPYYREHNMRFLSAYPARAGGVGEWRFAGLSAERFVLVLENRTNDTDNRFEAEKVQLKAQKMTGPWVVSGVYDNQSFRLGTGELSADGDITVRLEGTDTRRLELDGKVHFSKVADDLLEAEISGNFRATLPGEGEETTDSKTASVLETAFKCDGLDVSLTGTRLSLAGKTTVRLDGTGGFDLDGKALFLDLQNKRMHMDLYAAGMPRRSDVLDVLGGYLERMTRLIPEWVSSTRFKVQSSQLTIGSERLEAVTFDGVWRERQLAAYTLDVKGNAQLDVNLSAESGGEGWSGRFALSTADIHRMGNFGFVVADHPGLSRFLEHIPEPAVTVTAGYTFSNGILDVPDFVLSNEGAVLSGSFKAGSDKAAETPFEARLAARNFTSSRVTSAFDALTLVAEYRTDITLDARDFVLEDARQPVDGSVLAHVVSADGGIRIENFSVEALEGTNISMKGGFSLGTPEKWQGTIRAERLENALQLFRFPWINELVRFLPDALQDMPVNLIIETQHSQPSGTGDVLSRVELRGTIAENPMAVTIVEQGGTIQEWYVDMQADELPMATSGGATFPFTISARGRRTDIGVHTVEAKVVSNNMIIETREPVLLDMRSHQVLSGEGHISSDDLRPVLALFGVAAGDEMAYPLDMVVTMEPGKGADDASGVVHLVGRVGTEDVDARLTRPDMQQVRGEVGLQTLSLPGLIDRFVLATRPSGIFGSHPEIPTDIELNVIAARVELAPGYDLEQSSLRMRMDNRGLTIDDLTGTLFSGNLQAKGSIIRDGGLASVSGEISVTDIPVEAFSQEPSRFAGKVSGSMRFGVSSDRLVGLMTNLGGAGHATIEDLTIQDVDPSFFPKLFARSEEFADLLDERKLLQFIRGEFAGKVFAAPRYESTLIMTAGELRAMGARAEGADSLVWGSLNLNAKNRTFLAVGDLIANTYPQEWSGKAPPVRMRWSGMSRSSPPQYDIEVLRNVLAEVVLNRESERIRAMEERVREQARARARARACSRTRS
ncbi:MAG: AsmA-like C-terminal region-containing protein, partial [Methylobacteriaceae bacterium]|nr:AsmA-like C-terminal region-containing protein [Methylobacteriaceae bacterium]